ncbi:hypothetical protein [Plantactinospora sonchi]|uniref:Uncharacterized protein n=1 Tax=Plantactinospora sonchi TaxID=1544735 RepID=A0ABU7RS45_9ACTN
MSTLPRTSRIPAPLYAVAGVGDLAYQQLRRLPAVVTSLSDETARTELREKAVSTTAELREKAVTTTAELREKAVTTTAELRQRAASREFDLDRLRAATLRNAAVVVSGAQAAQERAVAVYGELVARGERVVGTGVVQAADTVNADMVATEAPSAPAAVSTTPTEVLEQIKAPAEAPAPTDAGSATSAPKAAPRKRTATKSTRPAAVKRTRPATDK